MTDVENPPFDKHNPEGAALWLEARARTNRIQRTPGDALTREHCNLLPHFAFRFEQIAELLRKQRDVIQSLARFADHPAGCPVAEWKPVDEEDFDCPECTCGLVKLLEGAGSISAAASFPPPAPAPMVGIQIIETQRVDLASHFSMKEYEKALEFIRDGNIPQGMSPSLFADRVLTSARESRP